MCNHKNKYVHLRGVALRKILALRRTRSGLSHTHTSCIIDGGYWRYIRTLALRSLNVVLKDLDQTVLEYLVLFVIERGLHSYC